MMLLALLFACHPKQDDSVETQDLASLQPVVSKELQVTYPDLTETERNLAVLSFLGFRTKEEAEILHLSLNTVEKYRTNIRKKAGSDPISHLIR